MVQAASTASSRDMTEASLISRAQLALSRCNWEVGECAALWTKRFARGRTDADFGALVGLSQDQVYQRRRVWETFGDVVENYTNLKWSHFYAAINWDDAAECLQWAHDVQAGVAEMKAWRRAQKGEDLTSPSANDPFDLPPAELTLVGETAPFDADSSLAANSESTRNLDGSVEQTQHAALATGDRTQSEGESYSPFRPDAATAPTRSESERAEPTTEQLVKRMTTAIERCHGAINSPFRQKFAKLPEKVRSRFLKAIEQLTEKTASLDE